MSEPEMVEPWEDLPRSPRHVANPDPFWPRIDLDRLRQRLQVAGDVSDVHLQLMAQASVAVVGQEFAGWRRYLRERGYQTLSALGHHAPARALRRCYLRGIERRVAWIIKHQTHATSDPSPSASRDTGYG